MPKRHKLERPGTVETVCEGIRKGLSLEAACARAGIHRATLYRWRQAATGTAEAETLRELQEAVAAALADHQLYLLEQADALVQQGDGGMIRFLLERRHGWRAEAELGLKVDQTETPTRFVVTIPIVERIGGAEGLLDAPRLLPPQEPVQEPVQAAVPLLPAPPAAPASAPASAPPSVQAAVPSAGRVRVPVQVPGAAQRGW
jgi:transcriptional regulator with XRE-family HTH domain